MNCVVLDEAKVKFGNNVFIAPNCGFYTAGHPFDAEQRNSGLEYARPITIGDNVWIGEHVCVLSGVTIGNNSVIGAGSMVNKDIPEGSLVVRNPCRIIRKIYFLHKAHRNEKVIVKRIDDCRFIYLYGAIIGKDAMVQRTGTMGD